jgi:hypothetical protein
MSFETAKAVIDLSVAGNAINQSGDSLGIIFFGGEPLLRAAVAVTLDEISSTATLLSLNKLAIDPMQASGKKQPFPSLQVREIIGQQVSRFSLFLLQRIQTEALCDSFSCS